jgi:hypothetical protein
MKYLSVALLFCVSLLFSSCKSKVLRGEGSKTTKAPVVSSFNAAYVDVSVNVVVNVQEGATPGIQIAGYENLLQHIKTKVENNSLRIYSDLDDSWEMKSDEVIVTITAPSINLLELSGATTADIHGNLHGNSFKLDISGASGVNIDSMNTDDFIVDASGAATLTVRGGSVKHASYQINGAGKIRAFPMTTEETIATISGAGSSNVTAKQKLTANISGAGTIRYKGHPAIAQDISGAGAIADAN